MDLVFSTDDTSEEMKDIIRCQRNLYNIPRGTFPLARDLGLSWGILSQPTPDAENDFTVEVVGQTQKYEPRVTITACTFTEDSREGTLTAVIEQERAK